MDRINPRSPIWRGRRVGLLGGSFNPAHRGHLLISRMALTYLGLDEVWWMVSPQNPLKSVHDMATVAERVAGAENAARYPHIRVTDIETRLGTRYTADTVLRLCGLFPTTRFVWLMGADNMVQVPKWRNWRTIFETVPVAVFGRPDYSLKAMSSHAARRFAHRRVPATGATALADMTPPAWTFIHYRQDPISATSIRAGRRSAT